MTKYYVCITCGHLTDTLRGLCSYCNSPLPGFLKPTKERLPKTGMLLGHASDGSEFRVPTESFAHHFAFYGVTGQGKTRLAMKLATEAENIGIKLLIIDVEGEWKNIIPSLKGKAEYYSVGRNLKINPFELNDVGLVTLLLKETIFKGIETEYQDLSAQMNYVLQKCIQASKSIPELIDNLVYYEADDTLKLVNPIRTKTALLVRLEAYRTNEALKEIFYCAKSSIDLNKLDDRNVIVDLHELERKVAYRIELRLLYNAIAIACLRQALAREPTNQTSHMFVADEAQLLAPKILRKVVVTDTWATTEFATRLRKRGECLVIISQSPSNIEDDIRKNSQTNFIFKLQDPKDVELVARSFGFNWYTALDHFTHALNNLQQRQALVKTSLIEEPFVITATEFSPQNVPEYQLRSFMPEVPINFTQDEYELLRSIREKPFIAVVERISELGWRNEKYEKVADGLVERGTIEKVRVKIVDGAPRTLYQTKGKIPSVKHEYFVYWIVEQLKAKGVECTTHWLGPDIQIPSLRTAINVELGTSDIEHNIMVALSQFQRVIVCSDDEELLGKLSEKNKTKSALFRLVEEVPSLFP